MKAIFKLIPENVSYHNRSTGGYEFISTVNTNEEFFDEIARLESEDFFEQEDGSVHDQSGNEVFDPKHPTSFDFGDYSYTVEEVSEISPLEYACDMHKLKAVEQANPFDLEDIIDSMN